MARSRWAGPPCSSSPGSEGTRRSPPVFSRRSPALCSRWRPSPGFIALSTALSNCTAPLVSGLGLLLLAGRLPRRGRELLLLSLPLLSPFPRVLAHAVAPLRGTAVFAALFLRAVGVPAVIDGQDIAFSGTGIAVIEPCTGLDQLSQLLALSMVVLCLVRTSTAQKIAVPLLALACGFLANAARVAMVGFLVGHRPSALHLWHGSGLYEPLFSAIAAGLTCLCWWLVLRPAAPVARQHAPLSGQP